MSIWTHVVGNIRVDGIPTLVPDKFNTKNVEKILGPMCLFDDWCDESTIPRGSEGGLRYKIIEYNTGLPWISIPIWGDLRDFGINDIPEIEKWWCELISKFEMVRDGILYIRTGGHKPKILTIQEEDD